MARSARELWLALLAILLITALYLLVVVQLGSVPAASGFFGHSLGIIGFTLMLLTEFLYSWRKRSRVARWGRMAAWLQFHIFTGIVGPYLVFLHSSFKFSGLAGVVLLFTFIVVLSGFIGRYIYTAVPRTAEGAVVEGDELVRHIEAAERDLDTWVAEDPETRTPMLRQVADLVSSRQSALQTIFLRGLLGWVDRLGWWRLRRGFPAEQQAELRRLEESIRRRDALRRQVAALATARRMLGLWHTIHVPLGVVLFTTAVIHIFAAIYYATLLR
ncbi:MAG TPA: hypothetical protein VMN57_07300 [Anaerolineales bacterium]|nr:hypothetical protein [Anaerolineales bacterium]